jgi:hypothetical protein
MMNVITPDKRFISGIMLYETKYSVIDMAYDKTLFDDLSKDKASEVANALNALEIPIDDAKRVPYYEFG